jgi:hypothetical protein
MDFKALLAARLKKEKPSDTKLVPEEPVVKKRTLPKGYQIIKEPSKFSGLIKAVREKNLHQLAFIPTVTESKPIIETVVNSPKLESKKEIITDEVIWLKRQQLWNNHEDYDDDDNDENSDSPGCEFEKKQPSGPKFKAAKLKEFLETSGTNPAAYAKLMREALDVEKKLLKDFQDAQETIIRKKSKKRKDDVDDADDDSY